MKKSVLMRERIVAAAAIALLAGPAPSFAAADGAADTGSSVSEADIIVTARKRSESLVDVPVAISALSGDQLARYNVNDLNRVAIMLPNVTIVKAASGTGASMTIRGLGSTFNDFGIDQTVSVNIDGIQISRGFITNVAFFDVAQVEVLKGPQALFFGKNSPAGVVSVRSNDPGAEFEASIRGGYEFVADEAYLEGYVSAPLTDTLGARLAVRYSDMKGYLRNTSGPIPDNPLEPSAPLPGGPDRAVGSDTLTGRLTLKWDPTDRFTANLKVLGNRYRDNGMGQIAQSVRCADGYDLPTTTNGVLRVTDPYGDCRADNRIQAGNLPENVAAGYPGARDGKMYSEVDAVLATLNMNYDLGSIALTSVTGYSWGDFETFSNYGYDSFMRFPGYVTETSRLFTQELRVNSDFDGPVNFAVGAYFEKSKREGQINTRGPGSPQPDPATGLTVSNLRVHSIRNEAISVFGQMIWDITDTIELAGGARFTHETKDTVQGNTYVHPTSINVLLPAGLMLKHNFKDDNISPEVTLSWRPQDDLTIYAAYKTGYKSGGASIPTGMTMSLLETDLGFGPEKAKGGEIGIKGLALDRRLSFSADAYSYNVSGLQLVAVENLPSGIFTNVVRNAAEARTRGAEVEVSYRATEDLSVRSSLSYNEAIITSYPAAPCWAGQTAATGCVTSTGPGGAVVRTTDRAGDPLSKAPKWTFTAGFDYDVSISSSLYLGVSGAGKYVSSYRTQDDGAPYAFQPAYMTVDATLRLREADDKWELAVIGRNLTNEYYLQVSSAKPGGLPGELHGVIARPREVALQATVKF